VNLKSSHPALFLKTIKKLPPRQPVSKVKPKNRKKLKEKFLAKKSQEKRFFLAKIKRKSFCSCKIDCP
jgi:hypothetical protein